MRLRDLVLVTGAFVTGVGWRTIFQVPVEFVFTCLLLSFVLGLWWRRRSEDANAPLVLLTSLGLLFLALGLFRTDLTFMKVDHSSLESSVGQSIELVGWVAREPEERLKTKHLYVKSGDDLVLVFADRLTEVDYGDVVQIKGELKKPQSFTTDLGREFDYPKYLLAKGVEYQISFAELSVVKAGEGNLVIASLFKAKNTFMKSLEKVVPEPAVGLGEGLLLGVKSALGQDIEDNFRRTGIIHIVVLSGYNVMLVVTFVMSLLSYFLKPRLRLVFGLAAVVSFALIVGLSATVVRASVMASLLIIAQTWGRKYDVLRALILAGVVMLIVNPFLLIYDIGFQLSFMATLGLLLVVPHFESKIKTGQNFFGWKDFLLATIATQIAVLPLLVYHIGEVSLVAVLVNLLVLPVVPLAMLLTFLTGLLALVSVGLAAYVGYLANLFLSYILLVAEFFGSMNFASVALPEVGPTFVFVTYGIYVVVYYFFVKQKKENIVAGWTIKEEKETAVDSLSESTAEVPVFFR